MPSNSTFNKARWVSMKGTSLLLNDLAIAPAFDKQYSGEFAEKYAIGNSVDVPMSQRYTVQRNDMTFNAQPLDRPKTTITMDQTATTALEWESIEQMLDMERGEERVTELYIKPLVSYMRQAVDSWAAEFAAKRTNMLTGALGTNPTTFDATSAAALQALTEMGAPDNDLNLFVPPGVMRSVKTGSIGYYNPIPDLSKQFRTGYVGKSDSFEWTASNSLYYHTAGTWAGAVTVTTSGQSGSTLNVTCTTNDTFFAGDKFSIAGVNQCNLMTRTNTSTASAGSKTFTLTESTVGASSAATLTFYPPIYGPGSHYQNVDALPVATAALTLWPGTSSPNGKSGKIALAIAPGAFALVSKKLPKPSGSVEFAEYEQDPATGIGIRIIKDWNQRASSFETRADMAWGGGILLAEQCAVAIACA